MDMLTDCAPACFSCDKLLYENRCPLDPDRPRAWAPGDLNNFFLNVTTLERFRHYNATIWSRPTYAAGDTAETANYRLGPWIVTLDDFATESECDRLIELGNNHGYVRSDDNGEYLPDGSYVTYYTKERTSYQAWCEDCPADPLAQQLTNRIEDLTGIPWTNSELLQLLRYTNGQKYDRHHDLDDGDLYRQPGVRLMTVFLYLSDVEEGGQTHFPQLNLTFSPKRGRIVIWPNVLDENPDEADPRTEHQAMPVLQGVKYSANSWIHQYDCQTPLYENCRD
jgi:prolyl 4-hydroxylase